MGLFQAGPRILPSEGEDVSAAVAAAFRASGMEVRENFGAVASFEKTRAGVRMRFPKNGVADVVEAALVVTAIGWVADADGLNLAAVGVERDGRGYVAVAEYLRTSAPAYRAAQQLGAQTDDWSSSLQ